MSGINLYKNLIVIMYTRFISNIENLSITIVVNQTETITHAMNQ